MTDTSLLQDFITESVEHLEDMETKLLQLESDPENNEILNDIFRSIHTIKGASDYMGMERIAELSHKLENLLDLLRKDEIAFTGDILDILMTARDRVVLLIGDLELTQSEETTIDDVLISIKNIIDNPNGSDFNEASSELAEEIPESSYDSELIEEFTSEAREYLEEMESSLILIKNNPENKEAFNEFFRAIHTIKGAADYMGIERIASLSKQLESVLLKIRQEELTPDSKMIQLIAAVPKRIALLVGELEQEQTEKTEIDDLSDAIRHLNEKNENEDFPADDMMVGEDGVTEEETPVEQDDDDLFDDEYNEDYNEKNENEDFPADDMMVGEDGVTEEETPVEQDDDDDLFDDEYNEEYDEELFDIFLEQLKESIFRFRDISGEMLYIGDQVEPVLEKYIDCIQGLYSSANYMGYEKLANYYEKWTEELYAVLKAGHPGEGLDWQDYIETKINFRINKIIKLFPQLQIDFVKTDVAEKAIIDVNEEPDDIFENGSVLGEEATAIAEQAELTGVDATIGQIDSDTDGFDDGSVLGEEASMLAISDNEFDLDEEGMKIAEVTDEMDADIDLENDKITKGADEYDLDAEANVLATQDDAKGSEKLDFDQDDEEITESSDEFDLDMEDDEIDVAFDSKGTDSLDLDRDDEEIIESFDDFDLDIEDVEIDETFDSKGTDSFDLDRDDEEITESFDDFDLDIEDVEIDETFDSEDTDSLDLDRDDEEITESFDEFDLDLEDDEDDEFLDSNGTDRHDLYQDYDEEVTKSFDEFDLDLEDDEIDETLDSISSDKPDLEDDRIAEVPDMFDSDVEDVDTQGSNIATQTVTGNLQSEDTKSSFQTVLGEETNEIISSTVELIPDDEIDKFATDKDAQEPEHSFSDETSLDEETDVVMVKENVLYTKEDVDPSYDQELTLGIEADETTEEHTEDSFENVADYETEGSVQSSNKSAQSIRNQQPEYEYSDGNGYPIPADNNFPVVPSKVSSAPQPHHTEGTPEFERARSKQMEPALGSGKTTLYDKLETAFDRFISHSLNLDSDAMLVTQEIRTRSSEWSQQKLAIEALFTPATPQPQPTVSPGSEFSLNDRELERAERLGETSLFTMQDGAYPDSPTHAEADQRHNYDPRASLFSQPSPSAELERELAIESVPQPETKRKPSALPNAKKNEALHKRQHHNSKKDKNKIAPKVQSDTQIKPLNQQTGKPSRGNKIKAQSEQKKTGKNEKARSVVKKPKYGKRQKDAPGSVKSKKVQKKAPASAQATSQKVDSTMEAISKKSIRVDAKKIDDLINQVGELVVSRAWFSQLYSEMRTFQQFLKEKVKLDQKNMKQVRGITFRLSEATVALGRVANELQEGVMRVRMLPIAQLFNRYPRLVRDLTHDSDKMVRLEVKGEDTELDKMIIEEISDPLIHIIRNAVDHGIETATERRRANKTEAGRLILEAYHESNHVVIEISDDGRGINPEKIKATALKRKLLGADELNLMPDKELIGLITIPGFSTASQVTTTSGRGVGMDVVRKNIEKLNGTLEIDSKVGAYTRFRIKIPLTLAIIPALLVKVGIELYTIPLAAVEETLRIYSKDTTTIEGTEVIHIRDMTLPLVKLSEIFGIPSNSESGNKEFVVIVSTGLKKIGLVVDALIGQEEVVIKPLEDYLQEKSGFSGATILGDGRISLILDVYELANLSIERLISKRTVRM